MPAEILLLLIAAKATAVIAAGLLVAAAARRASAAMRHAILVAAMSGSLLLPFLGAMLPTFSPVSIPSRPVSTGPELQRLADDAAQLLFVPPDGISDPPLRGSLRERAEKWRVAIFGLWFAGTAVALCRIAADFAAARRAMRRATLRGRLDSGVPLLESAEIEAPVAVGLLHPVIMIPRGMTFEAEALGSVIAHELAHIERRDCLTQLVVRLTCASYWFNPLVWYATRRIGLERERACDDRVLGSGVDPISYSQLLIDVARQPARASGHLQAVPSMAQPAHLERRIAAILDISAARGSMSRWRLLALVVAASCVVVPLAATGAKDGPLPGAEADPFLDPQSERVAGVREFDRTAPVGEASTADGALIAILRSAAAQEPRASNDLVPDRARWALSLAQEGRLIEPLILSLDDPDWRVRGYAAWALAVSRDSRAVEPLVRLLDHPVWRLRAMAAAALRQIGDRRATVALAGVLDDPAWQVRLEAIGYFGELHDPSLRARIEPYRHDDHIAVRLAADEALNSIQ